ncbi:MAG: ribonuclease activity regulator protein RraA [Haliea sp.]|jgi:regulator of ribonuclease activity A|uniref:ribonuclease E activity regulator RraA n=1 Tax=Haliea sp. TaxID=1932666 RepID=UPI000C3B1852|nr:ribonuclease E activity regulator RraA [Haliea sp.]MBM70297.1 ribonuclease activity regulator protein RraA [Haliea sp.]|tara:strand:- start:60768 stop:61247 length:480 start_codon:yes stop_codon:yes gene_type:complete
MQTFATPDLTDAAPDAQVIELQWRNFGAHPRFAGQAVTIKCHEDNSLVKQAVGEAGAGRVLVVDGGGSLRRALLGDMLAEEAARNGWSGLVINGAVRDVDEIATTALGVKALGATPLKTEKRGEGQRDICLQFGGARIAPGDYIYADNNGVVVSAAPLV